MLEAMGRIAPSQPNEAMAHISPRSPMVPMAKFRSNQARLFRLDSKLFSEVQMDSKRGLGSAVLETWKHATSHHAVTTETHNFTFGVEAVSAESPL
jgi:hypothetical protein